MTSRQGRESGPVFFGPMLRFRFYTRRQCPLCEAAFEALAPLRERFAMTIDLIDVDREPGALERYGTLVPALFYEDRILFRWRVDDGLAERIERLYAGSR